MTQEWFSRTYPTIEEFVRNAKNTPYKRNMLRLHAMYPKASLSQLRGHPKKGERHLTGLKRMSPSKMPWRFLKPKEKMYRDKSLDVLSKMRNRGWSLSKASKDVGILPNTVIRNTKALKKDGYRWVLKRYDTIPREMTINENGRSIWIEVNDSRYASIIGRYHSAVRQALGNNDDSYLKPFKDVRIKDSNGTWHTLETDLHTLYEIQERRPNEEFFMIYNTSE